MLIKFGCYFVRQGSNHEIWHSLITKKDFPIPRHKDIDIGLVRKISKQSGVKF
ncbi:MAG: type II toxin-antitoxin system HicA family toxin [Bacteroidales bacterium]|nr:type II toxin-antitoxin system HicA family toxin [Bacteroidales bacterium]